MRNVVEKLIGTDSAGNPLVYAEIYGTAEETKPAAGFCSGSKFTEVDTGVVSLFDEGSRTWTVQNTGNGKTSIAGATVTLGSTLKYNGSTRTKTVSSVKLGETTLTADTDYTVQDNTGVEVGDYTLHIVGKGSYTGVVSKDWSIAKGTGSVTASPDSLSLTTDGDAGTSTLTVTGDGAITVSSSAEAVATASVEDGTVTVTPVGAGSATVTVTLAEGNNYTGGTDTISVTVTEPEESEG